METKSFIMTKNILMLAMFFAFAQIGWAQNSNNQTNVFQGGVNFGTFEATNSEAVINQLGSSGTRNSVVSIQQVDDAQYAKSTQTNVLNSGVNLAQGVGSTNIIEITQVDGADLYFQARQFGSQNEVSGGQTGTDNFAVTAQTGDRNYTFVSQGGTQNHTIGYTFLNSSTHNFLSETDKFTGSHDPGGTGHYTDGIVQIGDDNLASLSQLGTNNGAFMYQEGNMNSGSVIQSGTDNLAYNLQRGNDNVSNITQDGTTTSVVNTHQGGEDLESSGNTILATQTEGADLYIGARQDGTGNAATIDQSNNNNRVFTAQNGNDNTITATQSGSDNFTIAYNNLSTLHTAFLDQHGAVVPKFKGDHKFDNLAQNTDGIVQFGDGNEATLNQTGDSNGAFMYQDGQLNKSTLNQSSTGDQACIMQRGVSNIITVNQ